MKKKVVKKLIRTVTIILMSATIFAGCGKEESQDMESNRQNNANIEVTTNAETGLNTEIEQNTETDETDSGQTKREVLELEVRFGDDGEPFIMQLEKNETAAAIARYVGTSDWRLPIYDRDENADYAVMQYYDIPSRYEIPSNSETITSEKAGEVYYSDPNRIVLFYHDAEISGEYTKIGTFDATDEFITAVEENPVLEGWGNKIVQITQP